MGQKECSVEGCDRYVKARGLCDAHYQRAYRRPEVKTPLRALNAPIRAKRMADIGCEVPGCEGRTRGSGRYCSTHKYRASKGLPLDAPVRQYERGGICAIHDCRRRRRDSAKFCPRHHHLFYRYGVDGDEYARMLAAQGGKCAICGRTDPGRSNIAVFCVDHDHATGHVRGLLCDPCNRGISSFGDDVGRLESAAAYLRRHAQIPLFGPAGPVTATT